MRPTRTAIVALLGAALLTGCSSGAAAEDGRSTVRSPATSHTAASTNSRSTGSAPATQATGKLATIPQWQHVVVVMLENRSQSDIIGSRSAPYLNALARDGASFTHSYAIRHPSEPNYLALFSGSTHGVVSDHCPLRITTDNLGNQLRTAGFSFTGYAESLPSAGYRGCTSGAYARKHSPWVNFTDLPASVNQPFSQFPTDFDALPTLSFVIPNLNHDMHNGTIAQADTWIRTHLGAYVRWMRSHNSLLVVDWDENDGSAGNRIPTIVAGTGVVKGSYGQRIDHYRMLRTLEAAYGLAPIGAAANTTPITGIFAH